MGSKNEEPINQIQLEEVVSDMQVLVKVKNQEKLSEVIPIKPTNLFSSLSSSFSSTLEAAKSGAIDSWNFTSDKIGTAKDATIEFSTSTADSLVHFTKEVGRKYDDFKFTPKFYSFINALDLVIVINGLQMLIEKQKKGSKEFIALTVVVSILLLLDHSKEEMKKEIGFIEINEQLTSDMSAFLKSVNFKDVVETAEPILLIIPNGNYILLILKLFV